MDYEDRKYLLKEIGEKREASDGAMAFLESMLSGTVKPEGSFTSADVDALLSGYRSLIEESYLHKIYHGLFPEDCSEETKKRAKKLEDTAEGLAMTIKKIFEAREKKLEDITKRLAMTIKKYSEARDEA